MRCSWCEEELPVPCEIRFHPECMFRVIAGPVAHLQQRCRCYVKGSRAGDPEGLTPREAALVAYEWWIGTGRMTLGEDQVEYVM
jgi:hypothetical protein